MSNAGNRKANMDIKHLYKNIQRIIQTLENYMNLNEKGIVIHIVSTLWKGKCKSESKFSSSENVFSKITRYTI